MAQGQAIINPALRPFVVDVADLHEDPKNARKHGAKNLTAICTSLTEVGQQKPIIVDAKGMIIAGNGTYRAACSLGWTEIAAVQFDGSARKAKQFALADNRTAELAEWDFKALSDSIRELDAIEDVIGWDAHELEPLLEAEWAPPAPSGESPTQVGKGLGGQGAGDAPSGSSSAQDARSGEGEGGSSGAPDPGAPREGVLFDAFTQAEQSWILKAMQRVRDGSDDVLTHEQAIARVAREYVEAFDGPEAA
jgi:hypothetical protein